MSNDPYQIGDVEYWKEGKITRFDPNSLAFKKRVYGAYRNTSIMRDKDSQKAGIQFKLNSNDTTISKNDALSEKQRLNQFNSWYNSQFTKSGTWQQRLNKQQAAQAYRRLEDINNRIIIIDSILSNSVNIQRWENEAYQKKQIELENQRIENERLIEIENQRIENERLIEIENQRIVAEKQKPIIEIQPEIIPAVVATSSLIPLAVIGLLLYTSRGKK